MGPIQAHLSIAGGGTQADRRRWNRQRSRGIRGRGVRAFARGIHCRHHIIIGGPSADTRVAIIDAEDIRGSSVRTSIDRGAFELVTDGSDDALQLITIGPFAAVAIKFAGTAGAEPPPVIKMTSCVRSGGVTIRFAITPFEIIPCTTVLNGAFNLKLAFQPAGHAGCSMMSLPDVCMIIRCKASCATAPLSSLGS